MKQKIIISILLLLLAIQAASAVATLSVGAISYDSTVVKDESITVSSSVTASTVTGTLTVDVTLTDNSGLFNIPTACPAIAVHDQWHKGNFMDDKSNKLGNRCSSIYYHGIG